ncbi:hypothetical protein SASPL_155687 [Salvia splendens]|uniref:Leucine-rich PPR motif-containing protein, mitochondrial n=2 Tax=Salvia splendens TaxID=180675 RepID=A0A8X8VYB8_SALSN|nr:hypothetical protein SASPL_155687 [Salvia splendens]
MKIMSELVQVNANVSDCERSNVYDILLSSFDFRVLMTVIGIPLCLIYSSRLISDTIWSQMVFMLLRKWGCLAFFLSIVATNCLLNGLSKMDCLGKCWEVHREMLRIQIRPNACTVNIFAHILCNEGHTDKVNEFLERMEEEGFDLDIVTYNMLVDGYCKNRRLKDAIYLYNIMFTRGMIPDLIRPFAAKSLLDHMSQNGYVPNAEVYNELICSLSRGKFVEEALELKIEMVSKGLKPKISAYGAIIGGMCELRRSMEDLSLMQEMIESGLPLDIQICRSLVYGLCKEKNIFEVESLLGFYAKEFQIFDAECYNAIVRVLSEAGDPSELIKLQDRMAKLGYAPNSLTCKYVIDGMWKAMKE